MLFQPNHVNEIITSCEEPEKYLKTKIRQAIRLHVALYGCVGLSRRKDGRIRVFEERVLRIILDGGR
jgi:hypothetical protein